jgi:ABC-type proline/glycine betaine transport system substrate-binding protein
MKPGKGTTVQPARATWNTGFFQEALVRKGLEELGYKVKTPKDLANPIFYKSVALGDVDYWTNGWFPMHNASCPKLLRRCRQVSVTLSKPAVCRATWSLKKRWTSSTSNRWTISNATRSKRPLTKTATARPT